MQKPSSSDRINVLIVDDHPAICEAIAETIDSQMDMSVVGSVAGKSDALRAISGEDVDLVIVDISLADGDGLDLLAEIHKLDSPPKTLIYSMHDERVYSERAIQVGADGYLMKSSPTDELVKAIRSIMKGHTYLSEEMRAQCLNNLSGDTDAGLAVSTLTSRERAIFEGLGKGKSLETIAEDLEITRKTAEHHRRQAKDKLRLESVGKLLQHAIAWVLSRPEPDNAPDEHENEPTNASTHDA